MYYFIYMNIKNRQNHYMLIEILIVANSPEGTDCEGAWESLLEHIDMKDACTCVCICKNSSGCTL